MITVGGEKSTLKWFEQIKWSYTSTCDFAQFTLTLSVFQNEHLYASRAALASTSLIWQRFCFARPVQKHAALQHRRLDTRRHMYGRLPLSDPSYGRAVCRANMAAIMRLSNIAMAYVHNNCGEWRRLFCTMLRLVARKTPTTRATKRGNNTAASSLHISKHIYIVSLQCGTAGGKKPRAVMQESSLHWRGRTELEAHKVCVTCSSTRGLNIYLFVTQGSLSLQPEAL